MLVAGAMSQPAKCAGLEKSGLLFLFLLRNIRRRSFKDRHISLSPDASRVSPIEI
jgi:hypothetical protein